MPEDTTKYKMPDDDLRKQAWDYFHMHASQRLTTFNFYIVISSVLTTGLAAMFKVDFEIKYAGVALGFLLILFSFIFWKIDERNKEMIKGAEETLKFFERTSQLPDSGMEPHIAKRFLREEYDTNLKKAQRSWRFWRNYYSYSECFKFIFLIFFIVGLVGAVLSLWKIFTQ